MNVTTNALDNLYSAIIHKVAIEVPVSPDFTGRLSVHLKNGKLECWYHPRPDELTATFEVFIELARRAGWKVTPPEES